MLHDSGPLLQFWHLPNTSISCRMGTMVAAALANGDCSQASACIDPPQPVSPVSWSCESGNQADACFRQALAAGGDKEGCALIDDVKANVADCFSTLECCADWPSWTASWSSDDGYASCDFGICAELDGKIRMVVKLAYTKEVFDADETLQTNYRRAWAAAVQRSSRGSQTSSLEQVDLNDVVIVGTAVAALDTQRRRLLTDAVDVTTQIRTTDAVSSSPQLFEPGHGNLNRFSIWGSAVGCCPGVF